MSQPFYLLYLNQRDCIGPCIPDLAKGFES